MSKAYDCRSAKMALETGPIGPVSKAIFALYDSRKPMVTLYGHPRSSCTWRVKIALALKGIQFEEISMTDEVQNSEVFRKASPLQQVPALVLPDATIIQSIAILEYLDEVKPTPPLLPKDPILRAKTRAIAEAVVSGIQPFQAGSDTLVSMVGGWDKFKDWTDYWIHKGFAAIEVLLAEVGGEFSVGDDVTMADLCLVPQFNNALNRYKMDMSRYPRASRVFENCLKLEAFTSTRPEKA